MTSGHEKLASRVLWLGGAAVSLLSAAAVAKSTTVGPKPASVRKFVDSWAKAWADAVRNRSDKPLRAYYSEAALPPAIKEWSAKSKRWGLPKSEEGPPSHSLILSPTGVSIEREDQTDGVAVKMRYFWGRKGPFEWEVGTKKIELVTDGSAPHKLRITNETTEKETKPPRSGFARNVFGWKWRAEHGDPSLVVRFVSAASAKKLASYGRAGKDETVEVCAVRSIKREKKNRYSVKARCQRFGKPREDDDGGEDSADSKGPKDKTIDVQWHPNRWPWLNFRNSGWYRDDVPGYFFDGC